MWCYEIRAHIHVMSYFNVFKLSRKVLIKVQVGTSITVTFTKQSPIYEVRKYLLFIQVACMRWLLNKLLNFVRNYFFLSWLWRYIICILFRMTFLNFRLHTWEIPPNQKIVWDQTNFKIPFGVNPYQKDRFLDFFYPHFLRFCKTL